MNRKGAKTRRQGRCRKNGGELQRREDAKAGPTMVFDSETFAPLRLCGSNNATGSVFRRLRVEGVAEAVAEEVEGEEGGGEKQRGEEEQARVGKHAVGAFLDENAP